MRTQRILVTGGAGFTGINLVNELRSQGHEVIALDHLYADWENYTHVQIRRITDTGADSRIL